MASHVLHIVLGALISCKDDMQDVRNQMSIINTLEAIGAGQVVVVRHVGARVAALTGARVASLPVVTL